MNKIKEKVTKQLEFAQKKLAAAESFSEIQAWIGYTQGLKYVLTEIETINETIVHSGE